MMKIALAAFGVLSLSLSLPAQSTHTQPVRMQSDTQASPSATAAAPRSDINACLDDLQRVTAATGSDIAGMQIEKWRSGWKSAWLKSSSRKQQAEELAASLHRNLTDAMPGLIQDVQNSHGSVSSTFKLYNDLNVVVESLDSLIETTRAYGKKGDASPLTSDSAAMGRLRQELSTYIQQTASSLEPRTKVPNSGPPSSSGVKKVVVDDNSPAAKPTKKKTAALHP